MRFNGLLIFLMFLISACSKYSQGFITKGKDYTIREFECTTKSKDYFKFVIPEVGTITEIRAKMDTLGTNYPFNNLWEFHLYEEAYDKGEFYIKEMKDSVMIFSTENNNITKLFDSRDITNNFWEVNNIGIPELNYKKISLVSSKKNRKLKTTEYIFSIKSILSNSGFIWEVIEIGYVFNKGITYISMNNTRTNSTNSFVECRCYK